MNASDLAVVRGWDDTRRTLRTWNRTPFTVLTNWFGVALLISLALLAAVLAVASLSTPDSTRMLLPGVNTPAGWDDVVTVIVRNLLVLALHSLACLAGFIAKSALPAEAESYTGHRRMLHDVAGPAAIVFVTGATLFSLATQTLVLGDGLSALSYQLDMGPAALLATLSIHALPELCALFLPLAAWLIAARSAAWDQLMAATLVTTAIALPILGIAAVVEVFVTPRFL